MLGMFTELIGKIPFPDGGCVLVEPSVLEAMAKFKQLAASDSEAGGVLIGYRRGESLHVVQLTTPMEKDIRTRFAFKRRDSRHQLITRQLWKESGSPAPP